MHEGHEGEEERRAGPQEGNDDRQAPPKEVKKTLKKPAACANATVKVRDDLNYDPKRKPGARYYGCATPYVDNGRGMWWVKPGQGRRGDRKFNFGGAENKVSLWRTLVAHVTSIQ